MADGQLTFRQRLFLEFYLGEAQGNATEAARRAGYSEPDVQGPRLLGNVGIQAAVDARLDEAALKTNEILARLSEQATSDLSDFVTITKEGEPRLDLKKARDRGKLHLVKKLTPTKNGIAVELYDAQAALVHLGKYRKLFTERVEQNVSLNVRDLDAAIEHELEDLAAGSEAPTPGEAPPAEGRAGPGDPGDA